MSLAGNTKLLYMAKTSDEAM